MLNKKLLLELQEYVEKHSKKVISLELYEPINTKEEILYGYKQKSELEDFIESNRKPTFNQVLFRFIDKKGANDSAIYKKAGIDRRHFSKIRSNPNYRPGKNTAISLALALELNEKDTQKLLSAAGYSLSDSDTFDLIIRFCIMKKIYDIDSVNQALDYFSLKPLGGVLK
jgi:hypothetical protein